MKSFLIRAAFFGGLLSPLAASATPITGSDSIALFDVRAMPSGAPLYPISGISSLSFTFGITSGTGSGNFAAIPLGSVVLPATFYPAGLNGGNGSTAFSFTILGYGTFTETGNPQILANTTTGSSTGVEFYLPGTFVPSGALSGFSANSASFDVSFTQTGASYSGSGTFDASAVSPEPSTMALLGTAMLAGALSFRKRLFA